MMDSKTSLEVSRSLYAQMCDFHEETEQHRIQSESSTRKTAILVQSIGTLLLIFVIVIGVYMSQLTNQFIQIVESIEKMNTRAVVISGQMTSMTRDVIRMNHDVSHMHHVLDNMKRINQHVGGMEQEVAQITQRIDHLNGLGTTAMETIQSMNQKMGLINQAPGQMNQRMYQISRPMKALPD